MLNFLGHASAEMWLFGPPLLLGATAVLIYFLYRLDRAPGSDKDLMG